MATVFAPKLATMAAVVALAAPAVAWAQAGVPSGVDPDRSAEYLNREVLQEIQATPARTVTRTTTVSGETTTATGLPASGTTQWQDQVEVFEDDLGERYVRVDSQGRVIGAPQGSPLYRTDASRYQMFSDASGNRYIRVDEDLMPVATADSSPMTDERIDDPTTRTMPQYEDPGQNEIFGEEGMD